MLPSIHKVEMVDEWGKPLLRITDLNGQLFFYYQDDHGNLILGHPVTIPWQDYSVYLFVPIPREWSLPYVLKIEYSK